MEGTLEGYLSRGIERLVKDVIRATLKNPKESAFMAQYARSAKRSETLRQRAEARGEHIPSFLIASITRDCNLRCAGCYANAAIPCAEEAPLSVAEWARIFSEAGSLGIAIILLAGGEPLLRPDVLAAAARHPEILFPVFTNGTMLDASMLRLMDAHRNLVPILSIEGDEKQTDARRGEGIYARTQSLMDTLQSAGLLYGASITVTNQNLQLVTGEAYVNALRRKGCSVVLFIEYVPVEKRELALSDAERARLAERIDALRERCEGMILIAFPGDEKESGGCLAAGRGFFHINAAGGAEPCPFSPYSDTNLRGISLRYALNCPLFKKLRASDLLLKEHTGGCVLFESEAEVKGLLGAVRKS